MSYNPHNVKVTVGGVELHGCSDAEFKQEHKKDYSLLRPFDLEAAKAGELLIDSDYDAVRFVGAATKSDEVCVEINFISLLVARPEDLFMAPLAWVEGRPVYKGDVLYSTTHKPTGIVVVEDICERDGIIDGSGHYGWPVGTLTWQKPKTKRDGWINIYPELDQAFIHDCKDFALQSVNPGCVATIRIEWEE